MDGIVVTTIQKPTQSVRELATLAASCGTRLVVVGDQKTPPGWDCDNAEFLSVEEQETLPYGLTEHLPFNSYARKMLGYLQLLTGGSTRLFETDDDNYLYPEFLEELTSPIRVRFAGATSRWVNPYLYYTHRHVWPRGLPILEARLSRKHTHLHEISQLNGLVVTQGLADGDPDVDAIYRMTSANSSPIEFKKGLTLAIPANKWAPFNSQVTSWPRELALLMYLPTTCSFRMTDIWRSFIAQRLMREIPANLVFLGPQARQERNHHDLMRDFSDEIEGYVGYDAFVDALDGIELEQGIEALASNLSLVYLHMCARNFFRPSELEVLEAWINDVLALNTDAR